MGATENIRLNKKFGYTMEVVALCIVGFRLLFKHNFNSFILEIALGLLLLSLIKPIWLTPLRLIWDKIGLVLGVINTYVLLTLFYFLILTPLGLMRRLLGEDILKLKHPLYQRTYWQNLPEKLDNNMKNQF